MRVAELATLYLLIGVGTSAAVLARARAERAQRTLDALLVLAFWPLYGPFLLLGATAPAAPAGLAALTPGADTMARLSARIGAAERRLAEIDALLARPEHREGDAVARAEALRAAGDGVGEKLAQGRVAAIRRLAEIRARFARELDQARELVVQLHLQGELVKLAGDPDGGNRELLAELTLKVECLEEIVRTGLEPV